MEQFASAHVRDIDQCLCFLFVLGNTTVSMNFLFFFTDCPVDVEDLNKLAQMHDLSKEDAVDYALFITCKKFISKVRLR